MTGVNDRLAEQIAKETQRIGRKRARQIVQEMRAKAEARTKAKRADLRRRIDLGGAVIVAGCGEWDPAEIVGTLADAWERFGASTTQRLGMKKKGQALIAGDQTKLH